ncbi:efflux RND transporter permease subunit [Methylocystis parvus]|uniref:Efflux pump membrane transporter n=1 Tax=Methylocystis parvus TaxID=134 RepID=A0A6B8M3A1_9HYPH|nr:efflux RND transporter permease subunit [Methylocystis parvus]QGM96788.1 efflux RND transporter permease subunit [Methylocystis parvus]WBJ99336.1 efflux RND transporter permease subunit [Methylocystis parvus OBBP]
MMSKFFIERPVLANVIAILLVVIGGVALFNLPISQYPNIVPPTVQVTARYPGASPQTVIDTVALPIELQVNGVDGMLYMQSTSASDGTYALTVTFKIGMDPDTAQVLVQNRVSNALASLPAAVQAQGVSVNKKSTAILQIITLTAPNGTHDAIFLSNYATINLVNELSRLPGVGNVNVFGSGKYAMRVWMDPEKLHAFGLQPSDVVKAIQQQSQIVASGQTGMPPAPGSQDFQYTIDIQSRLDDPSEFANIIVKAQTAQGGRLVRVKDIGRIELGSQNYSQQTFVDGKPAALIAIYQTPDANSIQVGKEVGAKMEELSRRFPSDLVYGIPYNTTIFVKASIDEVYHTLYEAGFLVLVVILFFLQNFRATLVPATTVPITIIGAFAAMAGLGYTVNLSTLFGIVLAIGIVVDDAIVITEAVSADIERGMSSHDAAIKAMSELMGPIIGITLVLMAVFLPAAFLPGLTGRMLAQFAVVIAATALISAINAATLKPTQCALWLRPAVPPEERNAVYRSFNAIYNPLEAAYTRLVERLVEHSRLVVIAGLITSVIGVIGIARLPTAFIPNEDQGFAMTAVQLPEGAALGRTINVLKQAGDIALATPGVKKIITIAGISVLDNSATLANAGVNYVIFDDWEERGKKKGEDLLSLVMGLQKKVEQIPEGRAFMLAPPPIQGIGNAGGFQMQLELLGGSFSYPRLAEGANGVVGAAQDSPVMQRVLTTFREAAPHVEMQVDRVQAETLRVPVGDVFSTLTSYVGSTYVNQFVKFGLPLQVYVQADSRYRLQPDDLLSMYVRSQDGNMIPLSTLARLKETSAPPLITLYNLYPSATIVGSPMRGFSSGQAMGEMESLAKKRLPNDIAFEWSAISYQEKITGNLLYWAFGLSVLLVYLVLAGQYESWILPLAVIAAVPLALIGPMLTLTGLGVDNNLYVQIGLMLLIALSAKNGILIVEVAREHRIFGGKPIIEAAIDAARIRFRPILMTSFAFILGVVPLAIATGAGANARRSLGISVLTGMLSSTCLAVLFVPAFFVVLQQFDEAWKRRKQSAGAAGAGAPPSAAEAEAVGGSVVAPPTGE